MNEMATPTSTIIDEIAAERRQQIEVEGWTHEHDDAHDRGQIAKSAACYAWSGSLPETTRATFSFDEGRGWLDSAIMARLWQRSLDWWKPKTKRDDLVRSAALIVAEIERLDRKSAKDEQSRAGA